jgi:hypothetical protein
MNPRPMTSGPTGVLATMVALALAACSAKPASKPAPQFALFAASSLK